MRDRRDLTDGPDTLWDIPIVGRERADREGLERHERHERPEPEAHVLARVLALAAEEQSFCVFDDVIAGGGLGGSSLRTDPTHDDALGVFDQLAIQAVVSQVTSSGTTLTVAIEHSADRRNWLEKGAPPVIDAVVMGTTRTNVAFGADAGLTPSLGFVRLRITLTASLVAPGARVALYVRARSR